MVKSEEFSKAEQLSLYLDSLNDGKYPRIENEEIKELVDLAALVKQSQSPEELPQGLIDEVVDNLAAELQAQKRKRKSYWLYSGLAGTAAAVVVAAFAQFSLPESENHNMAQQMDHSAEAPKIIAAAEQPSQTRIPEVRIEPAPQPVQSEKQTKTPAVTPVEEKAPASLTAVLGEMIKTPATPPKEENQNQVAILREEIPKEKMLRKNISMDTIALNSLQTEASIPPESKTIKVMAIPNQNLESVTVDKISGEIKQVYHFSSHDEVVITQSIYDKSKGPQPIIKTTHDQINSLTITIDNYTIKVEGKKSWEELKKIAESLIEKEIQQ